MQACNDDTCKYAVIIWVSILSSYADEYIAIRGNSVHWTPLSGPELAAFLAIFIAMGINCLPAIEDYWSANPILGNTWIKRIMSRNRFRVINRCVEINMNVTNRIGHQKIFMRGHYCHRFIFCDV